VRAEGGPFRDIFDFVERIDPKQVNKRAIENLARAGAFDQIHKNRAQIVASADVLIGHAQSCHADRQGGQGGLFGADLGAGRPRLSKTENWTRPSGWTRSWRPSASTCLVTRWRTWSACCVAGARSCWPTPWPGRGGAEAFRMCRRGPPPQERASQSGEKFAFVSLSDPTGEYEVLFPPESLRKCRDVLEPGKAVAIKVRAKARDGEVRFFGDDAEPIEKAIENVVAGLRVHLSPFSGRDRGAEAPARTRPDPEGRRSDLRRRHRWRSRDRAKAARPLHAGRRPAWRAEDYFSGRNSSATASCSGTSGKKLSRWQ
jgi:DNA polymerase-3 subunit alpha